jgi:pyruvate formate lyase activating enzyme
MNIDLKGFTQRFYDLVGGDLETVKDAIVLSAARCHVEVTTLIIPGENDSEAEMDEEARWLASIRPDLPLHISRFFPRHRMQDRGPTDVETVYRLSDVARRHLRYVYPGNC